MGKPRTGTMAQVGPARWRLQATSNPDLITGKRRRVSRTLTGTRTEATEALLRLVVETGAGLHGGGASTVADLLDEVLASASLSPNTRRDWESVARRHLKPALGGLAVWQVTTRHCDQLYARMAEDGIGQWRIKCTHALLHRAFSKAVDWGWVVRNPVSAANRPATPHSSIVPRRVPALIATQGERSSWQLSAS